MAALQAICDLALPRHCGGCAVPGRSLCAQCRQVLDSIGRQPAFEAVPVPCPPGYPPTWALAPYDGPVAAMLRGFKDASRGDLGPPLGRLLRAALAGVLSHDATCRDALLAGEQLLVVPMPSRAASLRGRGRAPTVELMRHAVRGEPPLRATAALRLAGGGRDQAGLGAAQRSRNVRGRMRVTAAGARIVADRACVVVDDIVTTGSSLVEARAALTAGGARHIAAATVAATRRHTPDQ